MHTVRKKLNSEEDYRGCCLKGSIPHQILVRECTKVLGLAEFDEKIFLSRVDKIVIPEQHVMVFHMESGEQITRRWVSTARKDWWTCERRKAWGERTKKYEPQPEHVP